MKISIVMPCYNAEHTLGQQLEAFSRESHERPWELIVADNGSTDRSRAVAERYTGRMPHLRVIDASARRSCASAKNIGAEAATGDVLAFCDADDLIARGWVSAMASALEQHDFVACQYEFHKLNPPWLVKARGDNQSKDTPKLKYPPHMEHAWGGSIGIHRAIHEKLGGYDESMRYLADTDYCVRAQLMGVRIQYIPEAVMHYRHRQTPAGIYLQARNWAEYDQVIFARYGGRGTRARWRWRAHANIWGALLKRTPRLMLSQEGRALIMWRLGSQVGYLVGSLRNGVAPIVE
jgi:glycosyltransferase involved in cell wall biosynthesis